MGSLPLRYEIGMGVSSYTLIQSMRKGSMQVTYSRAA